MEGKPKSKVSRVAEAFFALDTSYDWANSSPKLRQQFKSNLMAAMHAVNLILVPIDESKTIPQTPKR